MMGVIQVSFRCHYQVVAMNGSIRALMTTGGAVVGTDEVLLKLERWIRPVARRVQWVQVMLHRSTQATDILLPRWQHLRAPEVMLYRSAQAIYIFLPRWQ